MSNPVNITAFSAVDHLKAQTFVVTLAFSVPNMKVCVDTGCSLVLETCKSWMPSGCSTIMTMPQSHRSSMADSPDTLFCKIRHSSVSKRRLVLLGRRRWSWPQAPLSIRYTDFKAFAFGLCEAFSKTWSRKFWAVAGKGTASGKGRDRRSTHSSASYTGSGASGSM